MASRSARWMTRVGVAALAVGVAAPAAWAATWSPSPTASKDTATASAQYTWNYGSALGRTQAGDVAIGLTSDAGTADSPQSVYARIGKVDAGTKAVTWAKPKLLSPKKQIADRITLSTGKTNNNIYATWASQTKYNIDPAAPRVAFFRGRVAGSWTAPVRLSAAKGRVDYPVVAGAGNNVYIAYTNSNNGDIVLKTSANAGTDWSTKKAGATTRKDGDEGLGAWPGICAAGSNLGLVWLNGSGNIGVAISKNSGGTIAKSTITTTAPAGGNDEGWVNCDVVGNRIGITWNQNDGIYYAEYSTGSNGYTTPAKRVLAFADVPYAASYGIVVALSGTTKVGLAAPMCVQDGCDYTSGKTQIDLRWLESNNNGGSWAAPESLANSSVTGKKLNDSPSAIFYDANTRLVVYNGWTASYNNYRLYLSTGKS